MQKNILLATTLTLLLVGCAPKKLDTTIATNPVPTTTAGNGDVYQNVDPYNGNSQNGNGQYGNGQYGQNGDGQYGQNGQYTIDDGAGSYANGGLQNIYFTPDQYNITPEKLGVVSQNAKLIRKKVSTGNKVKIEGHCDASGTDEYNYALGLRRAKAAKDALELNGINGNSITLVSMGESSPECATGSSSGCYAKNRRVEFKMMQ